MVSKRVMLTLIVLVTAGLLVLSGCDTSGNGGGGGGGGGVQSFEEGDVLAGGYVVTDVDPAGGYVAKRLFNANPEEDADPALYEELQVLVEGRFRNDLTFVGNTSDNAEADPFAAANLESGEEIGQIVYYLGSAVFIGRNSGNDDTALTIEPGALIRGTESSQAPGLLVIDRGGLIDAQGTATNPIVMTSARGSYEVDTGDDATLATYTPNRAPGDWGGVVINGYGVIQGGEAEGEGGTGFYGGTNPSDSSGTLRYVRVEFGGTLFTPDNELNGIAFQGVGSGTTAEYIQVHQNGDDGVEFFGGNVGVRYVFLTENQDDSVDTDDGWNGSAQYVVIYDPGDHAIESDGDPEEGGVDPTSAILSNFTYYDPDDMDDSGYYFRRGSAPTLWNSIGDVSNDTVGATDAEPAIEEEAGGEAAGTVTYGGVALSLGANNAAELNSDFTDADPNDASVSISYSSTAYADTIPDGFLVPTSSGIDASPDGDTLTAQAIPATDNAGNALDSNGDFIGAVEPGTTPGTEWWNGWTTGVSQ